LHLLPETTSNRMQKANQFALNNGLASSQAASNRLSSRRSAERRGDYHVGL
jgi:hypothetical protein